jgi:hypothetical protein
MHDERVCSFCLKPRAETGTIVEGNRGAHICRACAELVISVIDDEGRRRQGERSHQHDEMSATLIQQCSKALGRLTSLSHERELTETELNRKRFLEAEIARLRAGD